ncbi:MAG: NAD-binding protein [Acidobacteriota bacterium]
MITRSRRRLLLVLAALPVVLTGFALAYMVGMRLLEGTERDFWSALEWAAETLTTTGYGNEASWDHPLMVLFVIGVQFIGVFLVYMLVPLLLLPLLEERFVARLPRELPKRLKGHVVIFRYGPAVETLILDLLEAEVPVALLELDEDEARGVLDRLKGDDGATPRHLHLLHEIATTELLRRARLEESRALVLNGSDEENAIAMLVAEELGYRGEVLALVEDPGNRLAFTTGGAAGSFKLDLYTPRHVLGEALAARASHRIEPRVEGIQQLGTSLRVAEIWIDPEGEIAGSTLAESDLGARTGATVVGQWVRGNLVGDVSPTLRLEPRGVLLAVGDAEHLDRLGELAAGRGVRRAGPFLVAGCGEVGRRVAELLRAAGEPVVVVDQDSALEGVDVEGDITDPEILDRLDLVGARALILALDSDGSTLFGTLVVKGRVPDLPIIARVNGADNLDRIHRAGADFALSVSQVSAQILGRRLLRRDALALGADLKILRAPAAGLGRSRVSALDIRRRTGCSVVAVERDGDVQTAIGPGFVFRGEDAVFVCGPRSATDRFLDVYG